jgi:hypothetical protein
VLPASEPDFPGPTSVVATSAHVAGKLGAFYTTDLHLFNADAARARDVLLRFSPAGDGAPPRTLRITLPPLATRALDDVVHDAFRMEGYGPLFLAASPAVVASTRTASTAPRGGSFGLAVPADAAASAIGAGTTAVLVPVFGASGFRVNVGVTEVTGDPVSAEVVLRDRTGALRALIPRTVPGGGLVQLNDVYGMTGLAPDAADRVEVRVAGGAGRILAWSTPVDDSTNDGSWVGAHAPAASLLIPAVARASGAFGSRFVTDLKISNAGAAPTRVRISFSPSSGPDVPAATVTLAGNETRSYGDVLATLFAPQGDVSGALRLATLDAGTIYASTRTSTSDGGRSYGLAIDPVAPGAFALPGGRLALGFLSASPARRTNVGFVETGGTRTELRVTLLAGDGSTAATQDLSLSANQAVQWNDVFAAMGAPPLAVASLLVEVLSGGSATAYAIVLDNRTNDASYFPAALVPPP